MLYAGSFEIMKNFMTVGSFETNSSLENIIMWVVTLWNGKVVNVGTVVH